MLGDSALADERPMPPPGRESGPVVTARKTATNAIIPGDTEGLCRNGLILLLLHSDFLMVVCIACKIFVSLILMHKICNTQIPIPGK